MPRFATVQLIKDVVAIRQKRIAARLTLPQGRGRIPGRLSVNECKERFVEAAGADLQDKAKGYFSRCVTRGHPWTFRFKPGATIEAFRERTRQEVALRFPLVYVYWGYSRGRSDRVCVYVGRTDGHPSRPSDHRKILGKYRVTQVRLFRVKRKRRLAAAECLAIHGYSPVENRMRAAHYRGQDRCLVCRRIRKAWKEFKALVSPTR